MASGRIPWRFASARIHRTAALTSFTARGNAHRAGRGTRCTRPQNRDPPDLLLKATETNTEALRLAKEAIRPGVPAHVAFEAARDRIAVGNVGYRQGRRVAYSIGIAFPPGWDEGHIISINDGERRPFQAGMTFHLITTMRIPGLGAVGCSDTVLVTEDGCETLTSGVPQGVTVKPA